VPEADNREARVDATISFLLNRRRVDTRTSALVLFLGVLRDRTDPNDDCYGRLADMVEQLGVALQEYMTPPPAEQRGVAPQAAGHDQQMIFSDDILRVVQYIAAVGRVRVPRIVAGRLGEPIPTGTGWLVAPNLALTCYHVVAARDTRGMESAVRAEDLEAQTTNSLLTFDYLQAGRGLDYRVTKLECSDPALDYALLRLEDRDDAPLAQRGLLPLAPNDPLTPATRLLVLQHPKGQPQQTSAGRYSRAGLLPGAIYHTAPTEEGTSGAPVINISSSWGVVALHRALDQDGGYRIATRLQPILADIAAKRPDLAGQLQ
jgi:hypothetical protein